MKKVISLSIVLLVTLILVFNLRNRSNNQAFQKKRLYSNKTIILNASSVFPEVLSKQYEIDYSKPTLEDIQIVLNPQAWAAKQVSAEEVIVFKGANFISTQQTVQIYNAKTRSKALRINAPSQGQVGTKKVFILMGGFGPTTLTNGAFIVNGLLQKAQKLNRPADFWLADLNYQGINGLKVTTEGIEAPSILNANNPYADYEANFRALLNKVLASYSPTENIEPVLLLLSTSSLPGIKAALENKNTHKIQQIIAVGPYTGLKPLDKIVQPLLHYMLSPFINLFANGLFQPTLFAAPWATKWQESLPTRLSSSEELIGQNSWPKKFPVIHLINSTLAYEFTTQLDNPPIAWTRSADNYFHKTFMPFIDNYQANSTTQIDILLGAKDNTVNKTEVVRLNKSLRKANLRGTFTELPNAFHNVWINNPQEVEKLVQW
jgi:hypothetical protein